MSKVSLTLEFDSLDELHEYLNATARADTRQAWIDFRDRPDVGVSAAEKIAPLMVASYFNPFAVPAVTSEVAVGQVPPPPPAPSTAVAAVPSTVPAAPPATSSVPPVAGVPPAPPLAPTAAVPAVPAVPPSPAGIDVDADGLPWDARIHAGGRAKNADGRWRQKRGLNDAALKSRVEAELRQAMGAAASVPAPLPPNVPPAVPAPLTAPVPAAPVASTAEAPDDSAPAFLASVGAKLAAGTLTQERLAAALGTVGLSTMAQLIVAPALIPAVRAQIDAA